MNQPATPQSQNTNINLHQQKIGALIGAALGLLGMILPWSVVNLGGFGGFGGGSQSSNGFGGWGILSLIGVVGVIIASLIGDKTKVFDPNFKLVAMGSFGAILLGAFIVFMQISGNRGFGLKTGIGLWICIIAGVLGILWCAGIIKMPPKTTTASTPTTPPAPPPPPSN
jgi:hypothetical protein